MTDPNAENPYASPLSDVSLGPRSPEGATESERLRRDYLKHEAVVRSLGMLLYFVAGSLAFGALGLLLIGEGSLKFRAAFAAALVLFAAGLAVVGHGIRLLQPWARIVFALLVALNIAATLKVGQFNIVVLAFTAVILYWLLGRKGQMVFSRRYRQAIAETPYITYRTARWVWIALGVIMLFIALVVLLTPPRH